MKATIHINPQEIEEAKRKRITDAVTNINKKLDEKETSNIKSIIYHYTSPEGLIGVLGESSVTFWFSMFCCVNDKTEGTHVYSLYEEVLDECKKNGSISAKFYNCMKNIEPMEVDCFSYRNALGAQTSVDHDEYGITLSEYYMYICCFSEDKDSLPLWLYYTKGQNNRGYNIGVSTTAIRAKTGLFEYYKIKLRKVIYDTERKKQFIYSLIEEVNKNFRILGESFARSLIKTQLDEWRLLFKPEYFSHENEVRAILKIPIDKIDTPAIFEKFPQKFRSSSGYIIPYVELTFKKTIVKTTTLGPLLDVDSAENGISPFLNLRGYTWVKTDASKVQIRY